MSSDENNLIAEQSPILSVRGLRTWFFTQRGIAPSVDNISFDIAEQETVCIVGESGCGKSVTALSLMKLVPDPPGEIVDGSIRFRSQELVHLNDKEMRKIRGNDISMIFQEPMSSLNPVYTVGDQIGESARLHLGASKKEARQMAIDMLGKVGISDPESRVDDYPHQMSGGMKQRVMIAMALTCNPELLIADEPTTALDVTIQAQILELINDIQERRGMSMLLITHDLGVVAEVADRVIVMYAGTIVEQAPVVDLFEKRAHPYTRGLFASLPSVADESRGRLPTIEGIVPSPHEFPSGCRFRSRCPFAGERCATERPELRAFADGHTVACHFAEEIAAGNRERTGPLRDNRVVRMKRDKSATGFTEEIGHSA
jgi:peptide/nickel transport system ATP-binding protein/oligopeptide transport system ATP-binding protein